MILLLLLACKELEGDDPGECLTGLDEDEDGLVDCEDPDCEADPACAGPEDTGDSSAPEDTGPFDEDGDGWFATDDCDDNDVTINPGAADPTVDGTDQDCDGIDGPDADGDGYVDEDAGGDDCDDANPAVNPGAEDTSVDGTDQDCSGVDGPDADSDGFVDAEKGGTDCDDDDAGVYPGAAETESDTACMRDADEDGWGDEWATDPVEPGTDCDDDDRTVHPKQLDWNDGIDSNCDGEIDENGELDDAAWALLHGGYRDKLGKVLQGVPDRDGDGVNELLIGSNESNSYGGELVVVESVQAGVTDLTTISTYAMGDNASYDHAVEAAGVGDFDGDGKGDVVTGGRYYDTGTDNDNRGFGTVYWGSDAGSVTLTSQTPFWTGSGISAELGETVAGLGDWDGDGYDDIAFGEQGIAEPTAHLLLGSGAMSGGAIDHVAEVSLEWSAGDGLPGLELKNGQDLDGDGLSDWVMSFYYANTLWVAESGLSGTMDVDDGAKLELTGSSTNGWFGYDYACVGDWDGDGLNDLAIVEYRMGSGYSGGWWLVPGGTTTSGSVEDVAILEVEGTGTYTFSAKSIAGGDITDDGLSEVLTSSAYTNSASIFLGGSTGTLDYDDADLTFQSTDDVGFLGDGVGYLGDVSGDGIGDFAVSAWQKSYPYDSEDEDMQLGGVTWILLGGAR